MYSSDSEPPIVVVVGNYGVGKSSFVRALLGDNNNSNNSNDDDNVQQNHQQQKPETKTKRKKATKNDSTSSSSSSSSSSGLSDELQMAESELIVEARTILIDDEEVKIVDTAARDVMGTQHQMQSADLVIVLMNASKEKSIDDLDEYWIDQFADASLYSPVIACFNQIDRLSSTQLASLQKKFTTPTKEHFVLETIVYCSAYTMSGINEIKECIINTLRDIRECPRWVLIDPYSWKLCSLFECALHRIFRLLDRDCDNVLNLQELEYFNTRILEEEFTPSAYNFLLRRLNEQNDTFVTPQGLTFYGFRHLMKRFAIAKKWDRCWDVLRHFHYQTDLTLHPRVFPQLPHKENDQTFELNESVYILLEKLFNQFADDTIMDDDNKSIASSMISSSQLIYKTQQHMNINNMNDDDDTDDDDDDDDDANKVLSIDGIRTILSVLPTGKTELHCTLLDKHVIDHFETAGRKLNKLTKNGWLSFWAMFAVENAKYCFQQLTYLDLLSDTDRSSWYVLTERKSIDAHKKIINRSVVRILLFGGSSCGKTVFCDRLLCRIPITSYSHSRHKTTSHFRAVSNRIGASNEYNFLAITEVPSIPQYVEQAMDHFLPAYDMILFMYDVSQSRSFYEFNKIFDRMPKTHALPIQVMATKSDLKPVQQYNQEATDDNNDKYDVNYQFNKWGLSPPAPTWLTSTDDSCDFPQLFDDLFFIATNPHYRRLKNQNKEKDDVSWKKIIKRTLTITVGVSIVLYSAYKLYRYWFKSSPNAHDSHHLVYSKSRNYTRRNIK